MSTVDTTTNKVTEDLSKLSMDQAAKAKVSSRGERLLIPGLPYMDGVMAGFSNPYDINTQQGVILMAVAENKLVWDVLSNKIQQSFSSQPLPIWSSGYGPMHGQASMRDIIAQFLSKYIMDGIDIKGDEISCATGCSSIISNLFYILCEAQDTILIPAPYYSAFDSDLRAFCELNRHPVMLNKTTFELTPEALEVAYQQVIQNTGNPPKALLMTNPHNPTGRIMPRKELEDVILWCESKGNSFHLISDEIYALSNLNHQSSHPAAGDGSVSGSVSGGGSGAGIPPPKPSLASSFISVGKLCNGRLGENKHVLWGMSKDFGMSGLRFGLVYTQNPVLYDAMANVAAFNSIPGPIQVLLSDMLSDDQFLELYLSENTLRLSKSCQLVMRTLQQLTLPFIKADSGMFLWANLGGLLKYLKHQQCSNNEVDISSNGSGGGDDDSWITSEEAFHLEDLLYQAMWKEANIVATPGSSQHSKQAGWFRFCYAAIPYEILEVGMKNLTTLVETLRKDATP